MPPDGGLVTLMSTIMRDPALPKENWAPGGDGTLGSTGPTIIVGMIVGCGSGRKIITPSGALPVRVTEMREPWRLTLPSTRASGLAATRLLFSSAATLPTELLMVAPFKPTALAGTMMPLRARSAAATS